MRWCSTLLTAFFALTCTVLCAQPSQNIRSKAIILKRMVELNHYAPRPVNDSFSADVFQTLLRMADRRQLLFTASEYKLLEAYKTSLDDELLGKTWAFFDVFSKLYKQALTRSDSIIVKITEKPFDFNISESISSSKGEQFAFSADRPALVSRWARYLKFIVLSRTYYAAQSDSSKGLLKDRLALLEPSMREKVKRVELKSLRNVLESADGFENTIAEMYLNAIASCFDPHTSYFSPESKREFQAQLSTQTFSFGLDLNENEKGQLVIERVVPGGPAWKSGDLNKGDELLSLQWEGKQEMEMTASTAEDAYDILDESVQDRMVFRFRKVGGTVKTVLLRKEKIENNENLVKGFILKGEKKIGYIILPGFYTEWENESGSSCANDVAKEIVKMKREKIDGLILDVRFNGGGSMKEAIDLIGIFIDEGPLTADKDRTGKQNTYRDPNRGTIYDGPMALMVNGQSASASEVLAASLQDYNRALIVGSNTYGKATMQQMLLMDTISRKPFTGAGNTDAVKITMGKLYRLTGQSAQLNGVDPDIVLPDIFDGLEYREKSEKFSLLPDTAKKNTIYKPLPPLPVSEISKRSRERVAANRDFESITKVVARHEKDRQLQSRVIPLKWDAFEKWMGENEPESKLDNENGTDRAIFKVELYGQYSALQKETPDETKAWVEGLPHDIYVQETVLTLTDLINLQKRTTN